MSDSEHEYRNQIVYFIAPVSPFPQCSTAIAYKTQYKDPPQRVALKMHQGLRQFMDRDIPYKMYNHPKDKKIPRGKGLNQHKV